MEIKDNSKSDSHFPEDPTSVNISVKRSFLRELYYRNKKETNYILFILLLLSTVITVSFSLYIVFVKYF